MAKISRRAVASSSSASAVESSSASSSSSRQPIRSVNNLKTLSANHLAKNDVNGASPLRPGAAFLYPGPLRGYYGTREQFAAQPVYDYESSDAQGVPSLPFSTALPTATANPATSSSSPPFLQNKTILAQIQAAERERIRAEFFATYDVMTGVRIAATLSGFFGLMVFLIVWKSRSSSNETLKVLKDPKMAAVAAVCMQEEEERKIQEAMVATGMSIYPDEYDAILYRRQRMLSLGNVSAPPVLHRGYRFSSVGGGYSSLLEAPRRFSYSYGGNSVSSLLISGDSAAGGGGGVGSVGGDGGVGGGGERRRRKSGCDSLRILSNYAMGNSYGTDDYFIETDDEIDNADFRLYDTGSRLIDRADGGHHKRTDSQKSNAGFLSVPPVGYDSRRSSGITCCSTESSYLERRSSAFTLGLSNLPSLQRKLSTASRTSNTDNWDYFYPDIQVIQPTPKASPCPSERGTQSAQLAFADSQITATTKSLANTNQTTIKTASKTITAANGGGGNSQRSLPPPPSQPAFVRKHSIAYYDPESAQAGRQQQILSISADTADIFPHRSEVLAGRDFQSSNPSFPCTDLPTEELRLNVHRKIAVVELQRAEPASLIFESTSNNNATTPAPVVNSGSLSMDSTRASIDKLNGSVSFGTAKMFFNAEKRAPLASLSSFKISSLECPDSDMRSLNEHSVFLDSVADTDDDIEQFSSESDEIASLGESEVVLSRVGSAAVEPPSILAVAREKRKLVTADERCGVGDISAGEPPATMRPRRPLLQRDRTISASSSDRISLIDQQQKDFASGSQPIFLGGVGKESPAKLTQQTQAFETHFGPVITTNSPPPHPRRAQLLQQYSDPHSLPTNTATNTEDDTYSTLNTEVCAANANGSGTVTPQTLIFDSRSSRCSSQSAGSGHAASDQTSRKEQLPTQLADVSDRASSALDSVVVTTNSATTKQPIICVPSSLKNLIIRGSSFAQTEKLPSSSTGFGSERGDPYEKELEAKESFDCGTESSACHSVMLELPLIKLPTEESSESSSVSNDAERSRSASDESRDPSLPGSSRKWSRETLF